MAANETTARVAAFAAKCGMRLVKCSRAEWGGAVGYTTADHPNCSIMGFSSKEEAYQAWMADTFGEHAGSAVMELLRASP